MTRKNKRKANGKRQNLVPDKVVGVVEEVFPSEPEVSSTDTEPTNSELNVIEAEGNGDTPTILDKLEATKAETLSKVATIKAEIAKEGEAEEKILAMTTLLELQSKVKALEVEVEETRQGQVRSKLMEGIEKAIAEVEAILPIRKLYYERTEVEVEGVKSVKPSLRINEAITTFGKRKVATTSSGNGSTKAKMWEDGQGEKLTSGELLAKVESQAPDVVKMIEGTAKVAPDRAIHAIQKKGIASLAWLTTWHNVEETQVTTTS